MAPCFTTVFLFVSEETTKIKNYTIFDRERVSSTVLQVWKLLLGTLKFTESELYIKVTFNVAVIFNVKVPLRLSENFDFIRESNKSTNFWWFSKAWMHEWKVISKLAHKSQPF